MKHSLALAIFSLGLLASAAMPQPANAALFSGTIVPAECHCTDQAVDGSSDRVDTAPGWGCVLGTIQNIINFAILLSTIITAVYLVMTGFSFMMSGSNSEARSKARTRFTNVFIGLAVLLCAWILVDFVMKTLYDQGEFGPWNSILAGNGNDLCLVAHQPENITSGALTSIVPSSGATVSSTGPMQERICAAASAYYGHSTTACDCGGNACAWSVNQVLQSAGVTPVGGKSVLAMESGIRGGRGQSITQAQASCGDLVMITGGQTSGGRSANHVGVCLSQGCSSYISNSSSRRAFVWRSSAQPVFVEAYQPSAQRKFYRLTN